MAPRRGRRRGRRLRRCRASYDVRLRASSPATTFQLPARVGDVRPLPRHASGSSRSGATFDVVNELSLEAYLRGVVPAEMPSSWPVAARTAQTIAARSYAAVPSPTRRRDLRRLRRHPVAGLPAACGARPPPRTPSIADTAGQVLRHGGTIANALFHSTGGGATESNENVYVSSTGAKVASPVAYLRGSADRDESGVAYDAGAPYATWQTDDLHARPALRDLRRGRPDERRDARRARPPQPGGLRAADQRDARRVGRCPDRVGRRLRRRLQRRPTGRRPVRPEHAAGPRADPLTGGGADARGDARRVLTRSRDDRVRITGASATG